MRNLFKSLQTPNNDSKKEKVMEKMPKEKEGEIKKQK